LQVISPAIEAITVALFVMKNYILYQSMTQFIQSPILLTFI